MSYVDVYFQPPGIKPKFCEIRNYVSGTDTKTRNEPSPLAWVGSSLSDMKTEEIYHIESEREFRIRMERDGLNQEKIEYVKSLCIDDLQR